MANFNTHLAVAAVGSGLCATVALAGHAAPQNYLLTLTLAGTIGGILPDIDLDKAIPSRILFSALERSAPSSRCSAFRANIPSRSYGSSGSAFIWPSAMADISCSTRRPGIAASFIRCWPACSSWR